jgi:K+-sensing histidine kinase KdpD
MDHKSRSLSKEQFSILQTLSKQALMLMEHCKKEYQLKLLNNELIEINSDLGEFAKFAANDLKSPVIRIQQLVNIYKEEHNQNLSDKQKTILNNIKSSTFDLKYLIEGTLTHAKSYKILENAKKMIDLNEVLSYAAKVVDPLGNHTFNFPKKSIIINCNEVALKRILINLFNNSIKHNTISNSVIDVNVKNTVQNCYFEILDNGPGIHSDYLEKVFSIYNRGDNQNQYSAGIGLATVNKLVTGLGGSIKIENRKINGLKVYFYI